MADGARKDTDWTPTDIKREIQLGRATALFQPVVSLETGACRGFEALARLRRAEQLICPDEFLGHLDDDDRLSLFGTMLGQGIALIRALSPTPLDQGPLRLD